MTLCGKTPEWGTVVPNEECLPELVMDSEQQAVNDLDDYTQEEGVLELAQTDISLNLLGLGETLQQMNDAEDDADL